MVQQPEIEEYLDALSRTGRKEITVRTYRKCINQCLRALEAGGRPTSPQDIGPDDFQYLNQALPQKEETRRAYMRALSRWCLHHTGKDPMKAANILFNREQRDRVFISDTDLRGLYEGAGPTLRMVIVLGACMGLRRAEICSIRDEDIRNGCIIIRGKGHGNGLVMTCRMPDIVEAEIQRYREWKSALPNSGDGYLIQNGKPLSKVSVAGMSNTFRQFSKRTGIRATLHSLRRYFATTLYTQTGSDITTVSRLMRHADASTTIRCYINSDDRREREAIETLGTHVEAVVA